MRKIGVCALVLLAALGATAEEPPKPAKEHEWLQQLVGEWTTHIEAVAAPGEAPQKSEVTETGRSLGGFWVLVETKSPAYTGILTLGYDPEKKHYVGTWVDSTGSTMWHYKGTLEGNSLTLEAEGPAMDLPAGKLAKYRDVIEVKGKDEKTLTSLREKDGKWIAYATAKAKRKK